MDLISKETTIQARPEWLNEEVKCETEEATLKTRNFSRGWNSCLHEYIKNINALPSAFEGMTCGEIIEALFQTEGIYKDDDFVEFVFKGETHTSYFTRDFWDSPYKGVSE